METTKQKVIIDAKKWILHNPANYQLFKNLVLDSKIAPECVDNIKDLDLGDVDLDHVEDIFDDTTLCGFNCDIELDFDIEFNLD
jgi:hypothetical protein